MLNSSDVVDQDAIWIRSFSTISDLIISLFLIFVIYIYINKIQNNNIHKHAYYKYFTKAIIIRIIAGIFFSYIYLVFYSGGDTIYYFTGTESLIKMAGKDFGAFFSILFGERTPELLSKFDYTTGYPTYFKDANTWSVCRFMTPFYILGMGSYWGTTIIMNCVLFIPIWNFYKMLCRIYPKLTKHLAIALFYFPSLVFWSSGILKDIWCLVALLVMYLTINRIFIRRYNIFKNILIFLFWAYILISIRPFMFYTGIVTTLLWLGFRWLKTIQSGILKTIAFPAIMAILTGALIFTITELGNNVAEGKYATVDSMLEHAVIIQKDLSRDAYGENSFNIGEFDASIPSMIGKAPVAIVAGIFRPFIWEARSLLMIFSGLESAFLIGLFLYLLFRSGIVGFFGLIYKDPFLLSSFIFVVLFGFFVGLTTANFGALVRYKIALLPFFTIVLFRVRSIIEGKD